MTTKSCRNVLPAGGSGIIVLRITSFRIFRLDPGHAARFREATPDSLKRELKRRRYIEAGTVEAESPYEAWKVLQAADDSALAVGDVLQTGSENPLLCTYWGFDTATWDTPEEGTVEPPSSAESNSACQPSM